MKSQKRWGIDVAEYTPIKTVIQTFEILDILSQHQKMGVSEMARLTMLPKSTIYRHLRTLVDLNVVAQDKDENYYLGYKMLKYQNHMKQTDSLIHHLKPFMRRLVEKPEKRLIWAYWSIKKCVFCTRNMGNSIHYKHNSVLHQCCIVQGWENGF